MEAMDARRLRLYELLKMPLLDRMDTRSAEAMPLSRM